MMEQSEKVYTLTAVTEVCVRFGVFMSWTASPKSFQWLLEVKRVGARYKHEEPTRARETAVLLAADEGTTTSREMLDRQEALNLV
jgi:hypothetical protein